jgi:hypothetical protein
VLVSASLDSNASWAFIFPAIWLDGTVVTMGPFDVADMLNQIARHRTIVDNVSSIDANFSSLECVITAGAPMPLASEAAARVSNS